MSILRSLSVFPLALLFPCASSAAQRTKLSEPRTSGDVLRFEVSPDGSRAVYSAKRDPASPVALFSVVIQYAASKLLDPGPCTGNFEVGGAGRVVYVRSEPFELCSVPIDGSAAPIVLAAVSSFRLGSGGHRAVFVDDAGLWVVPTDGSAAPALLQAQPTPFRFHPSINLTPDGAHVLYVHEDGGESGQGPLHAARLDRSTPPVLLNNAASECTIGSNFVGSPDGKWVVFRRGGLLFVSRQVLVVPIDGSAPPARLHTTRPVGSFENFFSGGAIPHFSPDGKRVVYQIDQDVLDEDQLFSAPVDGSAPPVELSAPLPSGGQVFSQRVSHDGEQVVYVASQDDAQVVELYVVPILGGAPRKLNRPGEHVLNFELSPDGRQVAYLADPDGPASAQIFLASLVPGPTVIPLSDPASPAFFVFQFDTEGRRIAYLSLLDGSHPYAVKTTGVPRPERLDLPSIANSSVNGSMRFAAGDSHLLYIADLERDDVFELWASPLEKRGLERR